MSKQESLNINHQESTPKIQTIFEYHFRDGLKAHTKSHKYLQIMLEPEEILNHAYGLRIYHYKDTHSGESEVTLKWFEKNPNGKNTLTEETDILSIVRLTDATFKTQGISDEALTFLREAFERKISNTQKYLNTLKSLTSQLPKTTEPNP